LSETSKRCAFLTLDERGDYVIDDDHAIGPLRALGWDVSTLSWRQTALPWSQFDAVIIRSTWDYWDDVPSFLEVLTRIDRQTRLANSLGLVNWNLAKTYLRDLGNRGVGIVPTLWLDGLDGLSASDCAEVLGAEDLVVKPVIGANGQDAFRFSHDEEVVRWDRIASTFHGRACMVQRFMPSVLTEGEFSLFFFGGAFSHAILKVPAAGEFRSQEERGAGIFAVAPEAGLLRRGVEALASTPSVPLYARIDFVRNQAGDFDVMELELIEPSLYLRMHPAAPAGFAAAIDHWFHAGRGPARP
jgi:hypothetical protein